MKADKVEARPDHSARIILSVGAMVEEDLQKFGGFRRSRPGTIGTTDVGAWKCSQNRVDAEVIQLEILFRRSFPVFDVRLIPNFP